MSVVDPGLNSAAGRRGWHRRACMCGMLQASRFCPHGAEQGLQRAPLIPRGAGPKLSSLCRNEGFAFRHLAAVRPAVYRRYESLMFRRPRPAPMPCWKYCVNLRHHLRFCIGADRSSGSCCFSCTSRRATLLPLCVADRGLGPVLANYAVKQHISTHLSHEIC